MKKVVIIHMLPLEYYPPITNFLDILGKFSELSIKVFSTYNNKKRDTYFNSRIKISRTFYPAYRRNYLCKILSFIAFICNPLLKMVFFKPSKIIYFEPHSAFPAYLYKKIFNKNVEIYIHNHEFYSTQSFEAINMKSIKYFHRFEVKSLYNAAKWISQTNEDRINLFIRDNPDVSKDKLHILPNYPPLKWSKFKNDRNIKKVPCIKLVYLGSLSLKATYIAEFCQWVIMQKGRVTLDIFAYNLHDDTLSYLEKLNSDYINIDKDGIEYSSIPSVLTRYDIGVILYKDYSENVRFCAPNKLFEYLACNLNVIYPDTMLGIKEYESKGVVSLDFNQLNKITIDVLPMDEKVNARNAFYAENALRPLIENILN